MRKGYKPLPVRPLADSSFIEKKIIDIPYGKQSALQKLDLYYAGDGDGPFPTIIYFHGGGFFMRDKLDDQVQAFLGLTRYGYVIASVNYRLAGEVHFPEFIYDTKAATRFLRANAEKYNLDSKRFACAGQSAGGYLAAMLAATGGRHILEDLSQGYPEVSSEVQACIDWFGCTDFEMANQQILDNGFELFRFDNTDEDVVSKFFGGKYEPITVERMREANPINYVTNLMPPTLIQHGRNDHLVAYQQSEMLYDKIIEKCGGGRAAFQIIEEADHDDPLFNTEENIQILRDFLDRVLKKS